MIEKYQHLEGKERKWTWNTFTGRILDPRYEPGLTFFKIVIKLTRIHVASFITQAKILYFYLRLHVHLRKTLRNYLWLNRSLLAIFQDKSWFSIWTELQNFPQMSVSKSLTMFKRFEERYSLLATFIETGEFLLVGCYCCTYIVYMYNWVERPSNGYRKAQKNWFLSTCAPSKKVNVKKVSG